MSHAPQTNRETWHPSVVERVDNVCDRFEQAWQSAASTAHRPRIEDYLGDTPEPERSALLHELLALEIEYRRQAGEHPSREEYQTRFPSIDVAQLTGVFATQGVAGANAAPAACRPTGTRFGRSGAAARHACHPPPLPALPESRSNSVMTGPTMCSVRRAAAPSACARRGKRPPPAACGRWASFSSWSGSGVGAFGAVWRARDTELDRIVAPEDPACQPVDFRDRPGTLSPRGAGGSPAAPSGDRDGPRGADAGGLAGHCLGFRRRRAAPRPAGSAAVDLPRGGQPGGGRGRGAGLCPCHGAWSTATSSRPTS